jgi:hypothetical protein
MHRVRRFDEWFPEQSNTTEATLGSLKPGQVIAWNFEPFRVIEVRDKPLAQWSDAFLAAWREAGEPPPDLWSHRPMDLEYRIDRPGEPLMLGKGAASKLFVVLPEHYAVCSQCGQLPPCRDELADRIMAVESRRIAFEMELTIGDCHGCGERVRPREHSTLYPGENLIRPDLGENTAVFHTRQSCLEVALAYQERWLTGDPRRKPLVRT